MPGQLLDVKCYLEGIEVPLESATISIVANQASVCTLALPPTNRGFKFRPRTRVHLFWHDDVSKDWLLLWEGEALALGFSKEHNSRSLQLSCMDLSNYWDYTIKMMMSLSTGIKLAPEVMFFGNTKASISVSGDALVEQVWERMSKKRSLPEAILSFLQTMTDEIPYYSMVNNRNRINQQIRLLDDRHVQQLLQVTQMTALTQNLSGSNGDDASLRSIINSFLGLVAYSQVSLGAPALVDGKLNTFLLTPNTYGCLPPRCNVILPDVCSTINYSRNFMQEPTRMWCRGQPIPGGENGTLTAVNCTAPAYLFKALSDRNRGQIDKSLVFKTFTDEELEKGVIAQNIAMPFPQLFSLNPKTKSYNVKYLQQYVDYMFQLSRYAGRSLRFSTPLNPWLACNFPCVVFDAAQSYFAQVVSVSHVLGGNSGGYTQVECNLAREIDVENDDSPFIAESWFNDNYQPKNIHATYQQLLGCSALGDPVAALVTEKPGAADGVNSGAAYQSEGANRLNTSRVAAGVYDPSHPEQSQYHAAVRSNSAYAFADAYRRRPLARMRDVFAFYGIKDPGSYPPTEFDGDFASYPANDQTLGSVNGGTVLTSAKYKRDIVKAYADELRANRALDGR